MIAVDDGGFDQDVAAAVAAEDGGEVEAEAVDVRSRPRSRRGRPG